MTSFQSLQTCICNSLEVGSANYMIYGIVYGGRRGGGAATELLSPSIKMKSVMSFSVIIFWHFFFFFYLFPHKPQSKRQLGPRLNLLKSFGSLQLQRAISYKLCQCASGVFVITTKNTIPTGSHGFCRDWLRLGISRGIDQGWTLDV